MKIAYDLDPLSPGVNNGLARIYYFRNEIEKSLEQSRKTIELDPNYAEAHFTMGMTYNKINKFPEVEAALIKAVDLSKRRPVMLSRLAVVENRMGKRQEVDQLTTELQMPPMNNDKLFALATIWAVTDKKDKAYQILDKLVDEKYGIMVFLKVERHYLEGAGEDPRYSKLLKRIGLE